MARPLRPSALFWASFLSLGGTALALRWLVPGHRALPWLAAGLLALLSLRMLALIQDWRKGRLPATRLLLPGVILLEGLGVYKAGTPLLALRLRLATALGLEILLLVKAAQAWRGRRNQAETRPEARLAEALEAFLPPRPARFMALELVMLGQAVRFILGGFRDAAPPGFSHHRDSPLRAILPALPLLIPGDLLLIHAIFPRMVPWLRWTLHASNLYAVLWLIGFYATLKARPHRIEDGMVHLHLGLMKHATFPARQVLSAAPLPAFSDDWARHAHMKGVQKVVAAGVPVLELKLAEPIQVQGLLGPSRPTCRLAVSVDEASAFAAALGCPCA